MKSETKNIMSAWLNRWFSCSCLLVTLLLPRPGFGDDLQKIMNSAQNALSMWDVDAAEKYAATLLEREPKLDEVLYLNGAVAFYRGEYGKAAATFEKIKNLRLFERDDSGYFGLSKEILKQKIDFQEKASEHFRIRYDKGIDEVMVPRLLQRMERVRAAIGEALDYFPSEKVLIEIYPSADAFIAASPLTEENVKTSGTIALCKYGRLMLTTPRSLLRGYPWMDTVSHEYVHYVIARKWGQNVPIWMHEGLAKYLEERWRSKESRYLSPSFENLLARAVRTQDFVSFEEMYPSFAMLPSAERAQLAYAQVASLVDFIVTQRGGFLSIMKMLDLLAVGKDFSLVFQEVLKEDVKQVLADWKKWLAARGLKETEGIDPISLQIVDSKKKVKEQSVDRQELAQIEAPSVREYLHLGDLLRYRGRLRAALQEYEKAGRLYPKAAPILATKLAKIYNELGEFSQAQAALKEVVNIYPEMGLPLELLADAYVGQGKTALACETYGRAIEINPFNPRLYAALVAGYGKLGEQSQQAEAQKALAILARQ